MAESDDEFFDAFEYVVPQKEKHFDVSDARPAVISANTVQTVVEELVKDKFAIDVTQNMTAFEYNMDHKHRGVAVIFNHFEYNDLSLEKRVGTDKDVEALQECLPLIGFEPNNIIVENDLTKSQVLNYSYRVSGTKSEIFENCDCIAIFILSHGAKGNKIYARDGDYDLHQLVEQYTPSNFNELAAKPKLFFINACRGDSLDHGVQLRRRPMRGNFVTDLIDSTSDQTVFSHPVHADILISMSSHHEHISFRNVQGSWYIQDFCETIRRFKKQNILDKVEITELLLYTHLLVSQRESTSETIQFRDKKQIPNFNSALCRKLYFKAKK